MLNRTLKTFSFTIFVSPLINMWLCIKFFNPVILLVEFFRNIYAIVIPIILFVNFGWMAGFFYSVLFGVFAFAYNLVVLFKYERDQSQKEIAYRIKVANKIMIWMTKDDEFGDTEYGKYDEDEVLSEAIDSSKTMSEAIDKSLVEISKSKKLANKYFPEPKSDEELKRFIKDRGIDKTKGLDGNIDTEFEVEKE